MKRGQLPDAADMAQFPDMLVPGTLPLDSFVVVEGMSGRIKPRTEAEIRELADSIEEVGQRTAVEFLIGTGPHEGHNVVAAGHGRIEAIRLLVREGRSWPGGPGVKAVLSDRIGDFDTVRHQAWLDGLHENIHRQGLKPCDIVGALETLATEPHNMTDDAIAKRLKLSPGYISQHRSYSALEPEVRAMIDSGRLSFRNARPFFGKAAPEQRKLLKQQEQRAQRGNSRPVKKKAAKQQGKPAAGPVAVLELYRINGPAGALRVLLRTLHNHLSSIGAKTMSGCRAAAITFLAGTESLPGKVREKKRRKPITLRASRQPRRNLKTR